MFTYLTIVPVRSIHGDRETQGVAVQLSATIFTIGDRNL